MGILFAMNMLATNVAFLYISYPTQVIASSSRYLFVILVGSFLSRVPHQDYLKLPKHKIYVALLITLGVILFNVGKLQGRDQADHHAFPEEWKGYILVIVSMTADAFLCDNQAYSKALFKPSVNQLFVSTNFWAFFFVAGYSITTGSFFSGLKFLLEHPQCFKQLAIVCALQVTGQTSIFYIVGNFKQHIFPLISATRKIITIVCSILLFNHTLSLVQWVAVGIVFAGMIVEVYEEITEKSGNNKLATGK
jgi:UDP-galactose transporter B1